MKGSFGAKRLGAGSRARLVPILVFVFSFAQVHARDTAAGHHPVDDLVFKIVIYGPYDPIFIWWGHAALIVHNTRWNFSRVFDWGIFSYPSDSFLQDFLLERVRYRSAVGGLNMRPYIAEDRDIIIYTLNLDRRAKEIMLAYAENSVLPENRYYDYHQFLDNCATRIRDIIDMGTKGQFRDFFENAPGRLTIRQHVRRFTWFRPFSEWFLCFMLGQVHDRQISAWDEMFLPVEIGRNIVNFSFIDYYGAERQLVSSVEIYYASRSRPPILHAPIPTWPFFLKGGFIIATLLFQVKAFRKKYPRSSRIILGLAHSFLGLFFGILGIVLIFGKFFMNNDYFRQNFNLLFINPLFLVIVPLGIFYALDKVSRINPERCLRIFWNCVLVLCGLTVIIRPLPFFFQQNYSVQGLIFPIALALSCIPDNLHRVKPLIDKLIRRD